jgi:UDP-N-acetylglucosamine 2-epimerase
VLAPAVRDRVIAAGFARESVVVTGNPAFDGLQSDRNRALADQFVADHRWQGLVPILWAGQLEPAGFSATDTDRARFAREVEDALRSFVSAREDLALIVRYHPGEWQFFERRPDTARIHFSEPLAEAIHPVILAARAVVVQNSTVGLEAAIAGRPVVSMEASVSVRRSFSLARLGVSTPCEDLASLPALLDRLLQAPASTPGGYASDGQAAHRVARVIAQALALPLH